MGNLYTEWSLQLINGRTGLPINDDTGIVEVLKEGRATPETIYATAGTTTAITQAGATPPVFTNGRYRWFTTNDVTAVDFIYLTADGDSGMLHSVAPSDHRIVIWPETSEYVLTVPLTGASGVTDTGFRIWDNMLVSDCFLRTLVTGTAVLIDIGTSTDPNGFLDNGVVTATGWKYITELGEVTSGTAIIKGALIRSATGGTVNKLYGQANTTSGSSIITDNQASATTVSEAYIFLPYKKLLKTE